MPGFSSFYTSENYTHDIILDRNTYIQICVTDEQKHYARELVEHSLRHHHISNIWDKNANKISQTRMMRFTGSLGEIVFADTYHLPRPLKSFGATDGQDFGQDFLIQSENESFSVDIKSMKRKSGQLGCDYVLNIPASQLQKQQSKTTHYFCISFHQCPADGTIASLLGFIDKFALLSSETGKLYKAGTTRIRSDRSTFVFFENTYEVMFSDIDPPIVTESMRRLRGYRPCVLK